MKEVTIKAHTRKSKLGKTVKVNGYTRRVGKKGVRSPARKKGSGDEFSKRAEQKGEPTTEIKPDIGPYAAENSKAMSERYERLRKGKTAVHSYAAVRGEDYKERKSSKKPPKTSRSWRDQMSFMEKVEDKVAKFVEKYSKKKYKRQV